MYFFFLYIILQGWDNEMSLKGRRGMLGSKIIEENPVKQNGRNTMVHSE